MGRLPCDWTGSSLLIEWRRIHLDFSHRIHAGLAVVRSFIPQVPIDLAARPPLAKVMPGTRAQPLRQEGLTRPVGLGSNKAPSQCSPVAAATIAQLFHRAPAVADTAKGAPKAPVSTTVFCPVPVR